MKKPSFEYLSYTDMAKVVNFKINIIMIITVILSIMIGFLSTQLLYTQKTIILHDKINLEALSCVKDPNCSIQTEYDYYPPME